MRTLTLIDLPKHRRVTDSVYIEEKLDPVFKHCDTRGIEVFFLEILAVEGVGDCKPPQLFGQRALGYLDIDYGSGGKCHNQ